MTTQSLPKLGVRLRESSSVETEQLLPTWKKIVAVLVGIAPFGPYLSGSIRTEQTAVYGLSLILMTTSLRRLRISSTLFLAWVWVLAWTAVGTMLQPSGLSPWGSANWMANIDNLLLPLAVLVLVGILALPKESLPLLRIVLKTVILACVINSVLAVISVAMPDTIVTFLRPFWANAGNTQTTAEAAMSNGRFSGIFNQPAEAGVIYSIAAIGAATLFFRRSKLLYSLIFGILSAGGFLSLSKIYIFVGLPLTLILTFLFMKLPGRIGLVLGSVILALSPIGTSLISSFRGSFFGTSTTSGNNGDTLSLYTAGRWNTGSDMLTVINYTLQQSPFVGFGIDGLNVSYDSQWTETIVLAGLLGALGIAAVFVLTFRAAIFVHNKRARYGAVAFSFLLATSALGIPSLTANRVATVVWLLIALLHKARHIEVASNKIGRTAAGHASTRV